MTVRLLVPAAFLSMALTAQAGAQTPITDGDRFAFWNSCFPVELLVDHQDTDSAVAGVSSGIIAMFVKNRLEEAEVYGEAPQYGRLYIHVLIVEDAYNVQVSFHKFIQDWQSEINGYAATYHYGITGMHEERDDQILAAVFTLVDQFMEDYLRVNEAACGPAH